MAPCRVQTLIHQAFQPATIVAFANRVRCLIHCCGVRSDEVVVVCCGIICCRSQLLGHIPHRSPIACCSGFCNRCSHPQKKNRSPSAVRSARAISRVAADQSPPSPSPARVRIVLGWSTSTVSCHRTTARPRCPSPGKSSFTAGTVRSLHSSRSLLLDLRQALVRVA